MNSYLPHCPCRLSLHFHRRTGIPRTSLCKKVSCWSLLTSVSEFNILLIHVLHCGAVSSRRGLCLTTRSPHYGYEPQQRSAPGNMHLQNNMTPCFQDGGHAQGQARTMKSIRLCVFMQKREISFSGPLGKHLHSACDARPIRLIKNRLGAASHVCRCGFQFILKGVLWLGLAESFILYFLGGVLSYTHYLRWSLFLSRFRIIILKERGATTGIHHGSEKLICARSLWGRGCR